MTTLSDLFDLNTYQSLVSQGYIRVQTHPNALLSVANYAEKAVYEKVWTLETLRSRGLVYDSNTLEVVARPFEKFFNVGEHEESVLNLNSPVEVTDKADGSLGVFIPAGKYSNEHIIATRGSFTSDQAYWATKWINDFGWDNPPEGITPLFEIIYKENRIVLSYPFEALVLLGGVDIESGEIYGPNSEVFDSWVGMRTEVFEFSTLRDALSAPPREQEGFVVRYLNPGDGVSQVKIKEESYILLHKAVTGLSEKSVWEMLGEGKTVEDIKANVPDELFDWVDETARNLMDKAQYILDEANKDFTTVGYLTAETAVKDGVESGSSQERGIFARHANTFPVTRPFLFRMLDGTEHDVLWSMAWKQIKPTGDTRVWNKQGENND